MPVVFIAGCSYSGTTILGILLGADASAFFAGEVNQYMRRRNPALRQAHGHYVCTCGSRYQECAVWGGVHRRNPEVADLNPAPGFSRANLRLMFRVLVPRPGRPRGETPHGAVLGSLHEALKEKGLEPRWIVDSSKSIQSLDALVRSGNLDLRVLHIVRDGEAVASSYKRRGFNVYFGMCAWALVNPLLRWYLRTRKIPNLKVDYRTLCESPGEELRRINAFLGTALQEGDLVDAVRGTGYHMFGGNKDVRGITRDFSGLRFRGDRSALRGPERVLATVFLRPLHRLLRSGTA